MKFLLTLISILFFTGNCFSADLVIFSGAGLIKPLEEFKQNFEQSKHIKISVHYGGSGEIFGQLAAGQPADVFIPGAEKYTQDALKNGWVIEETIHRLVDHIPVIATPGGNPAHIRGLMDLAKPGVRVSIGDPKAPAIGRVAKKIMTQAGVFETIKPNIKVLAPTVNQLLIYVALEQVDAAIIWKDMTSWAEGKGKIDVIPIERQYNIIMTIPTAVCTRTTNKPLAMAFNSYLASEDGKLIWKKWGFEPCTK
ncbi:MAG: molybdate ABC transporter substrate-binding protein [Desulfobacterales bacterium]|nr:molybdate ABC transporter substrate-binding protein [Desulfobacterales bacterium]MDD4071859.1 molybdate ABC transporter substrate-binding protein [Desulfobacterales bacterium]MDD4391520.1 molybdate ABC transporter substrate-binding protein [Desulfobacterales bacterium]